MLVKWSKVEDLEAFFLMILRDDVEVSISVGFDVLIVWCLLEKIDGTVLPSDV